MCAAIRSLADALRRFGDDRLVELLRARPDLASPVPQGISPLAARAAGAGSARRALGALTLPQLHLVEALATVEDGVSPSSLAQAVSATPQEISPALERLQTLALVWGEDELHLLRPLREGLRSARVRRTYTPLRPPLEGEPISERIPGTRTAQAVDRALEAVRLLTGFAEMDDDPPGVLRKGGIPQRDLRRLTLRAGVEVPVLATVLQSAWLAGLIGHDGEEWHPTRDWDTLCELPETQRWAELVQAWAHGHHLAAPVGTPAPGSSADTSATSAPRALLSDDLHRDGIRARRLAVLRFLYESPGIAAEPTSIMRALAWSFPLVPPAVIAEEVEAVLLEGQTLGVIDTGALTELGIAVVDSLGASVDRADTRLTQALAQAAPDPVDELLIDSDGTVTIPGRPAPALHPLLAWSEVVSRGGGITLRLTSSSVRQALGAGRDPLALLDLLQAHSRTPVPQTVDYLVRDEMRRHGRVEVSRASTVLTAEPDVLDLLTVSESAAALSLRRLAPTVAVTSSDAGFVLQVLRRAGVSPAAVGADGRSAGQAAHLLHGRSPATDLVTADGPDLRVPPDEAVARLRAADAGQREQSVSDRLLAAIAESAMLELGVVDGRGGVERRRAVPLALDGGRLRARDDAGQEFTVLVHRVTLA